MWVVCAGMMRSGSTVQYQIARSIVEASGTGQGIGFHSADEFARVEAEFGGVTGVKVLKSHRWISAVLQLPPDEVRVIYSYRDLRDVVVSWMHKAGKSFDQVLADGFVEDLLEDDFLWTRSPGVLVSRYESMVDHLEEEVHRIAAHLGIPTGEAVARAIADEHGIERQRERIRAFDFQHHGVHVGGHVLYDGESLLHHNHIRSGRGGEWREELAPTQVQLLEAKVGRWLQERGYRLSDEVARDEAA